MKRNDILRSGERSLLSRLRDRFAPESRRPHRSFVPLSETCEPRGLMSGLVVAVAAAAPSGSVPASGPVMPAPQAAIMPLIAANAVASPDESSEPPPVPVDPLLGTVSWG